MSCHYISVHRACVHNGGGGGGSVSYSPEGRLCWFVLPDLRPSQPLPHSFFTRLALPLTVAITLTPASPCREFPVTTLLACGILAILPSPRIPSHQDYAPRPLHITLSRRLLLLFHSSLIRERCNIDSFSACGHVVLACAWWACAWCAVMDAHCS